MAFQQSRRRLHRVDRIRDDPRAFAVERRLAAADINARSNALLHRSPAQSIQEDVNYSSVAPEGQAEDHIPHERLLDDHLISSRTREDSLISDASSQMPIQDAAAKANAMNSTAVNVARAVLEETDAPARRLSDTSAQQQCLCSTSPPANCPQHYTTDQLLPQSLVDELATVAWSDLVRFSLTSQFAISNCLTDPPGVTASSTVRFGARRLPTVFTLRGYGVPWTTTGSQIIVIDGSVTIEDGIFQLQQLEGLPVRVLGVSEWQCTAAGDPSAGPSSLTLILTHIPPP